MHFNLARLRTHILENCVGDQSLAWKVESQMKITQQNKCLEGAVNKNADSELQKFKRHIREDKYM